MRGRRVHFSPDTDDPNFYGAVEHEDSDEEERRVAGKMDSYGGWSGSEEDGPYVTGEYDTDEEWERVMAYDDAGAVFGRKKRGRRRSGATKPEPTLEILAVQAEVVAEGVFAAVTPILKGLRGSRKKGKQESFRNLERIKDIRRELDSVRRELVDVEEELRLCNEKLKKANPDATAEEVRERLEDSAKALGDVDYELDDTEQAVTTLENHIITATEAKNDMIARSENKASNVIQDIAEGNIPASPPPPLPPRDPIQKPLPQPPAPKTPLPADQQSVIAKVLLSAIERRRSTMFQEEQTEAEKKEEAQADLEWKQEVAANARRRSPRRERRPLIQSNRTPRPNLPRGTSLAKQGNARASSSSKDALESPSSVTEKLAKTTAVSEKEEKEKEKQEHEEEEGDLFW